MKAIVISPPSEEASELVSAVVSAVLSAAVSALLSVLGVVLVALSPQAVRQPSSMTTANTRLRSFIIFFIFIYLALCFFWECCL